jgi:hypothetical protein
MVSFLESSSRGVEGVSSAINWRSGGSISAVIASVNPLVKNGAEKITADFTMYRAKVKKTG